LRHGVTQPAMSNALRRLRDLFDDPLFMRTPEGMAPTPRALELAPTIEAALGSLRGVIKADGFDPGLSRARFTLGTLDYLEALYAPDVVANGQREGPGTTLQIRRLEAIFQLPEAQLAAGAIDCALGLFPQPLAPQAGLHGQVLGEEDWVCVVRRGHPALAEPLTLERYAALRHVGVNYLEAPPAGMIDRRLSEHGLSRTCAVWTPHISAAPFHAAASDCVATVPRGLAQVLARSLPLEIVELPLPMPSVAVSLVWNARVDRDPSHRWFRALVADSVLGRLDKTLSGG
jgi:DNA-binding transcriptional LysR family regulator